MATLEAEDGASVHPDTITALGAGSGTSQPDHNTKHPTLTMEAHQWGRDSGDTWITMNRCLNVTHVFFSSPHHQRSWGQGRVDSTTPSSASTTCCLHTKWMNRLIILKSKCFQALLSLRDFYFTSCIPASVLQVDVKKSRLGSGILRRGVAL